MRLSPPAALVVLSLALSPVVAHAGASTCTGVVFEDGDGDGVRDDGERGLGGVAVSDGIHVRRTGADGRYTFAAESGRAIFVVKPAGYRVPAGADGLPRFWRDTCGDFALRPDPRPAGELDVLLFADPQPKNPRHVGFYGRAIVDGVRAAHPGDAPPAHLGLTLGDIVDDDVSLFPAMNRLTTSLGVPWLHAPGNHDVDVAHPTDDGSLRSFHATYGPDTYAWEEHEAVFVVLDDVIWQPGQSPAYIGGLREDQFRFLVAYLRDLPAFRPLVIAAHMPFFDDKPGVTTFRPADRERLFALLQRFAHVRLLTGHGHVQRHHWHDAGTGWRGASPLHEYNVGAACGSYWGGVDDAAGVPTSWMVDGTPKGWAEMTLRPHGAMSLRWRAAEAGVDPDVPMALHAPAVLRRGSYPGFAVYANVFMGHAQSRVEYRIDDGDWMPMARVERADPRVVAENVADARATVPRAFDLLPEAAPSTHLWRGRLPTDLAAGDHRIAVRAYDPWRGELTATTRYRLVELAAGETAGADGSEASAPAAASNPGSPNG